MGTTPVLRILRTLADLHGHTHTDATSRDFCAASKGIVIRALHNNTAPFAPALRAALFITGDADLQDMAANPPNRGDNTPFAPLLLNPTQWARLLNSTPHPVIMDWIAKNRLRAKGSLIPILGKIAAGSQRMDTILMDIEPHIHDVSLLHKAHRGLIAQAKVRPYAAALLRAQVTRNPSGYIDFAQSSLASGDPTGGMLVHMAGVPLDKLRSHTGWHPKAKWIAALNTSSHGRLALQSQLRSLEHLLEHQRPFADWVHGLQP